VCPEREEELSMGRDFLARRIFAGHLTRILLRCLIAPSDPPPYPGQIDMNKNSYPHGRPNPSRRVHVAAITIVLALASLGCNSEGDSFTVDGTWAGSVAEADADITLVLTGQGKNGIAGLAQVTTPPEGTVPGTVSGTRKGKDVDFTIGIDDVIVGGSLVFDGAFQSDDVISGTVGSGILGGTFSITFQRSQG
jgi:hypothetical protein